MFDNTHRRHESGATLKKVVPAKEKIGESSTSVPGLAVRLEHGRTSQRRASLCVAVAHMLCERRDQSGCRPTHNHGCLAREAARTDRLLHEHAAQRCPAAWLSGAIAGRVAACTQCRQGSRRALLGEGTPSHAPQQRRRLDRQRTRTAASYQLEDHRLARHAHPHGRSCRNRDTTAASRGWRPCDAYAQRTLLDHRGLALVAQCVSRLMDTGAHRTQRRVARVRRRQRARRHPRTRRVEPA